MRESALGGKQGGEVRPAGGDRAGSGGPDRGTMEGRCGSGKYWLFLRAGSIHS